MRVPRTLPAFMANTCSDTWHPRMMNTSRCILAIFQLIRSERIQNHEIDIGGFLRGV